jgi:hypothetical protein
MGMACKRGWGPLLALVVAGVCVLPVAGDESQNGIAVRLDTTPEDGGKVVDNVHPQRTKSGFEIGAIPLFKRKLAAKPGQSLRVELPYAATGYAWEYTAGKQGAVVLSGPVHGKVEEIPPAAGNGAKDQAAREKRNPDRPAYGSGQQANPPVDGPEQRERRSPLGRPQLQVFEFQVKERGSATLVFSLSAVSDPLPKQFCSVTVNVD